MSFDDEQRPLRFAHAALVPIERASTGCEVRGLLNGQRIGMAIGRAAPWPRPTSEEIIAELAHLADDDGEQLELLLSRDDSEHDALAVRPHRSTIKAVIREAVLRHRST